jgi:xylulokinase
MIASMLGQPLSVIKDADFAAATGAARLAITASGAASLSDAAFRPRDIRIVEPFADRTQAYAERFEMFRALYPALRPFESTVPRTASRQNAPPADRSFPK